ncbi:coniferyl-aldehyde dehydrogenase [Marinobacter persicus]|uniref:Aldehyde dehydrogenase n=1 Tax=Marinobacter persicus TaxID=930118 RepID=A0A1I3QSA4_9GAMM|nr:coniferyl aldehyde dehydrogenase [Marinobacter persicus]GHD42806.1 putative coniferyl aldehyde dehydrogenase [Marinobacter persicus]SFJ36016.1 coniferyl-aldehyde dehydrogenase [Marinobacter persicus]
MPAESGLERTRRVFARQREAFRAHPAPAADERRQRLATLRQLLLTHQHELVDAIDRDFSGRSADETRIAELLPSLEAIHYARRHLGRWMKAPRRRVSALFRPAKNLVIYQPKGVAGIIVPWNYPLYLAIGPMVAALAAGNRVMVKMSEFTPHTSALLQQLVGRYFDEQQVCVITGEADVAAEFSRQPFDHLLFTGSTTVGRLVMRAAADNLTPVTLELGGKSPAIIGPDVPMADAASRIAFGKALNAGQTCVAPDYVLCPAHRVDEFVAEFRKQFGKMYPSLGSNPDYTAIINERQYHRLQALLKQACDQGAQPLEINPANEDFRQANGKMPVTLLLNTRPGMAVMEEEIFGPILPVVPYTTVDDAINYVNDRPRPLALYFFSYDKELQQSLLARTHSGGACINDTLMHVAQEDLPFGGIGDSGMGHYHGKEGFLTFSHQRAVFIRQKFNSGRFVYPPHGGLIHRLVYKLFIR